MQLIDKDSNLKLQLVLTDMHLDRKFGYTVSEVKKWFKIAKTIPLNQKGDSPKARTEALGKALEKIAGTLNQLKPDIVLLLGDRSETLIAAFASLQLRIPVAHVQGGEISGNIDGIQRHAITKLCHIHFAETKKAAQRLLKLGEEKWRVHFTGAPYIDFIKKKLYTPERKVRKKIGLSPKEKFFIILQHPVTTEPEKSYYQMRQTLKAVKEFSQKCILIYPCSDQGHQGIIDAIEQVRGDSQFLIHKNIGASDFIGLEAIAQVLIGNSSAGIYEAPYLYLPVVNIGKRQAGRERENNVIDVVHDKKMIAKSIEKALYNKKFSRGLRRLKHTYGDGRAYKKIVKVLKKIELNERLLEKRMTY
jgi:UDP-N-acetylglucosamine 2-epimerase (non-hydrolysing)/GDP/UDP-N,N'-diacetylbacillosamine 2-epimerase (hydrolysing)